MEDKLAKYFSGESTEEEKKEILEWRSANESNSEHFFKAKNIWVQSTLNIDVNTEMLNAILEKDSGNKSKSPPLWKSNFVKIAASIAILVGLSVILYQAEPTSKDMIVAQATIDQTLPDGSVVTLHKGSTIEVGDFKTNRKVKLVGKAYFDIKRDENKPFIITTNNAKVEVLGTSFVIDSKSSQRSVEVLVESGLVVFSSLDASQNIQLAQGEMGALDDKGDISKNSINDQNYLAWKTKKLVFDGATLEEVAAVIKDVYDVDLKFENEGLKKCRLNGEYVQKSSNEVLDIISQTFGFELSQQGAMVFMKGNACN